MPAVKEREYKTIMVDAATHQRLRGLAGEKTIAGYLRQISQESERKIEESKLEEKISKVMEELVQIKRNFAFIMLMRHDSHGKWVPVKDMEEADGTAIPILQASMIQDEVENDPDVSEVGWYRKNSEGKWEFKQKEFDAWYKQHIKDQDALMVAYEALDSKGNRANSMSRQELIDYGRKLLARKGSKKRKHES